ncbi:transmembrane 7 superfamily member 3-like isoform X2 [Myxocyprinus asiaticus]|uniref:transmembrane 7 superfamily member 3-like isoform X2 n=1 Tax=Myxocyprinus asiaticus TaxID=70543 RepID=UPI002221A9F6|nr:transmembrane 7 superfamily member 3-like isoform X2 [Myxocyprinus asiaticus]
MPLKRECLLLFMSWLGSLRAQDENRVVFSLGKFQNVSVPVNGTVQVVISRIPPDVSFITLQFHTPHRNVTLSYTQAPVYGQSVTAADAGLLSALLPNQSTLSWFLQTPDGNSVAGIGVMLPYMSADPVPGACNQEFPLDIDPNIYLQYNLFETTISFAPANIGYTRGGTPPACDVGTDASTRWRLVYDVYQFFLPEGDQSEQSLISGVERVANVENIQDNSRKVMSLSSHDQTQLSFNSLPGQGVIFSVVVRDPVFNTSASYIPVHTYACSFNSTLDGCSTLGRVSTKVFFTVIGVAGLFVCFLGHRFFKCELFCMGFAFMAFFFFVLITSTTALEYNIRLALTAVMGVVGGVVLVMSWWRFGSVMVCVLVVGLILGFLVSSIVFFTPLGDLPVFHNDVVFWVVFTCIMVVVPLFFIRWPREVRYTSYKIHSALQIHTDVCAYVCVFQGNITTCGVVGAYVVVLTVNAYTYTSLSYITLDVLKRFLNHNFSRAFISVPLQDIDFIMITLWVVLGISGIVVQLYRERSHPFFPPSPYVMWKQERERRKTNVLDPSYHKPSLPARILNRVRQLTRRTEPAGESTPLLL